MKLFIASDIHGSEFYCKKMIDRINEEKPDKILLLGDLLYHGPRNDLPKDYAPKKVIEMLNGIFEKIICVRGNCEAEVDQMVLDFPVLADYAYVVADGVEFFATHGHHFGETNPPKMTKGTVLLNGHTHVAKAVRYDNFTYLNPGSVSIPKESTPNSYMIVEKGEALFKTIDGEEYNKIQLI